MKIIGIDLFSGCGGLSRGLLDAGIEMRLGIDIDKAVKDTYELNNKPSKFLCNDVSLLSGEYLLSLIDKTSDELLLLAGSPPCQPFSKQNKNSDNIEDDRRNLVLQFGRIASEIQPDYVLLENVPGLMKQDVFGRFIDKLGEKYQKDYGVLDAKCYGIPQNRKRLIFLASKKDRIELPKGVYGKDLPFRTVRETIKKYPPLKAGKQNRNIPNHQAANLSKVNLERLKHIKRNGGSRTDLPTKLQLKCHKKYSGHSDVYGRMSWDNPAPTLTCKCGSISNGRFGHPTQTRAISLREAAALQSFPDNFVFHCSLTQISSWIGNAVPPKMAYELGKTVIQHSRSAKTVN